MPGSIGEDELRTVIGALQQEGLVDFVDASAGDYFRTISILEGMHAPAGYELASSSRLTEVATVPTIVTGRFRTLEEAEKVIADGVADMVSMVRAHIADPDIVRKTREGRALEVRPCIACNQGCVGGLFLPPPRLGCAVNPAAGWEATLSEDLITPVAEPRSVLVVGGGPAGLEAARVAALAGHDVTLVEASSTLGGAVSAARRGPRTAVIGDIVEWLESAVRQAGVNVQLDTRFSAQDVRAEAADVVILATGSRARLDGVQPARPFEPARGVDQRHVVSSTQLLYGALPAGARAAVVLDTNDNFEAITAAEYLVDKGLAVTFVTTHPSFGGPVVQSTCRDVPALEFLHTGDFTVLARHHLVEIGASSCIVAPLQGRREAEVPADVVVLVTQNEPERQIYDEVAGDGGFEVMLIGDAASPRNLQVAMAEGHRVGRAIGARVAVGAS
jgi:NADPH-dependent 2,4-dienoyl-CoA reductase/sulfur reductase-like enzyme